MIFLFGDYFESTSSQRKGALFILLLIAILGFFYLINYNKKAPVKLVFNSDDFDSSLVARKEIVALKETATYFQFDPNTINVDKWMQLGFSKKQAKTIIKYKEAIGGFSNAKDLAKCYVISSTKFNQLLPYIKIKPKPTSKALCKAVFLMHSDAPIYDIYIPFSSLFYVKKSNRFSYYLGAGESDSSLESVLIKVNNKRFPLAKIDSLDCHDLKKITIKKPLIPQKIAINSSSASTLTKIRGIGPVLSTRIISYREKLGGFISLSQLDEVYGIENELLVELKSRFYINDSIAIRKLNVNFSTIDSLKKHPYIDWSLANAIVAYREHHGPYDSIESIWDIQLLDSNTFFKIRPYITIK